MLLLHAIQQNSYIYIHTLCKDFIIKLIGIRKNKEEIMINVASKLISNM